METILFYLIAAGVVGTALAVVAARSPIASVLALLGSFFFLAIVYLMAGFQLMAVAQILVYAGAIMVLFLFVIMLLDLGKGDGQPMLDVGVLRKRRLPVVLGLGLGLLLLSLLAIRSGERLPPPDPVLLETGIDSVIGVAEVVFGRFLLAFEASGILLLAAAVAVLVLAKRQRRLGGEELAE